MKIAKINLLLLLLITNNLFSQMDQTKVTDPFTLEEKEKKIRKKNSISESFEYIHQVNSNDSILKSHKTYNKNGELLTNTVFSSNRDTTDYAAYEYAGEKLIKSNLLTKNKSVRVFNDIRSYIYDKNGNNTETQIIDTDGKITYQKTDYNRGNLKKVLNTKWLNKTDFSVTVEYFYSKNKSLIKEKTYMPNGKLFCEVEYQY